MGKEVPLGMICSVVFVLTLGHTGLTVGFNIVNTTTLSPPPPENVNVDFTMPAQHSTAFENHLEETQNASVPAYDLASCYHNPNLDHMTIKGTAGYFYYRFTNSSDPNECPVTLEAPQDKVFHFQVSVCQYMSLIITNHAHGSRNRKTEFECDSNISGFSVYSFTSRVSLTFFLYFFFRWRSELSMKFSTINQSERPDLEVTFLSLSQGLLQTPGWDGRTRYQPFLETCVTLTPPAGHVIFFNFLTMDILFIDFVFYFPGLCIDCPDRKSIKNAKGVTHTGTTRPEAFIHPPSLGDEHNQDANLSFFFASDDRTEGLGFRARFSFYPQALRPRRVGDSEGGEEVMWNCSASVWPDLAGHFPCDLVPQCAQSEDEASCPYTSHTCGLGKVEAGGRCYIYIREGTRSWLHADKECRQHSAFLLSLETHEEWTAVFSLLQNTESGFLWLGLKEMQVTTAKESQNTMYANTWRWESASVAYYSEIQPSTRKNLCAGLKLGGAFQTLHIKGIFNSCETQFWSSVLCETSSSLYHDNSKPVPLPNPSSVTESPVPLVTCPLQHVTHAMLACDAVSVCRAVDSREGWHSNVCHMSVKTTQHYFHCGQSGDFVPYSLLCDFQTDCGEGSDEDFCVHLTCTGSMINCGQGQCVDFHKSCDGYQDCTTNLDESNCPEHPPKAFSIPPPAVVHFNRPGGFTVTALPDNTTHCPDTHFRCHHGGYCLPVYVRCNAVNDCPDHEDELWCTAHRCPGFYRCRGTDRTICVHLDHLCDGRPQCPQHDDELMCDVTCPKSCTCYGLAFTCTHTFQVSSIPQLRYLEARGSGLQQADVISNIMLVHLGVQACGWDRLTHFIFPNIHSLDLSDNLLRHVNFSSFKDMLQLRRLSLAGNPMSGIIVDTQIAYLSPTLMLLNLSQLQVDALNMEIFSTGLSNLQVLDLSQTGLKSLWGRPLLQTLTDLNLLGCSISDFTPDVMKSMNNLNRVFADNFKMCCPAVLPDKFTGVCFTPSDKISSCDDLLKSTVYRSALAVSTVLAIVGNACSFIYRVILSANKINTGFAVFVLHLCVSDFFMGVYLAIIGVADQVFAGAYVWSDTMWKRSKVCSVAGFLSFLSSEVSAFIICLITLDRFLVLHFPFSQIRFRATSAHIACIVIWTLGLILTTVPLLPVTSHWEFYHQTGICIPLPVTRADFAGHSYSFSVMIVCNLVLFLLIAVGQSLIYWSVRSNAMSEQRKKTRNKDCEDVRSKEAIIARRLLTIAMSDFLCWFPIGLCGLLAAVDVVIPGEVNVALAIFVLPLNSALNPFLYTVNVILEKRQKAQELRFQKFLHAHLQKNIRGGQQ